MGFYKDIIEEESRGLDSFLDMRSEGESIQSLMSQTMVKHECLRRETCLSGKVTFLGFNIHRVRKYLLHSCCTPGTKVGIVSKINEDPAIMKSKFSQEDRQETSK